MSVTELPQAAPTAALYTEIQQFYAQQMHLLDDGRVQEWAGTFTQQGVFAANAQPVPAVGREAITKAAQAATDAYAKAGVQRRHWLGMVSVEGVTDGAVSARCYALVIETPRGGRPEIKASTLCQDRIVRVDGDWQIEDRQITRDDLI
ncbi:MULTISPECIES: nuclear transport factor 2 family protein [unclassified Streptomyces]|uniref:nuclear transport factor 2 family protein n=1 Tax=unclassified Streptomyces TaxID=2593676 RepID=UPI0020343FC8|nr:nuclear transport factor 2 family protein [Streptomyces sp. RKAG290]MCM2414180.1 nuclear transport factor 2 family protein [Streptomyces sp. RKAG290]